MKLNQKGFSLIELLAVVIILSTLMAIMIPSVNSLINKNRDNNYNNLENSIKSAAKVYISDNRYKIAIDGICNSTSTNINIKSINSVQLNNSNLSIQTLIDSKDIKTTSQGKINNPKNKDQVLDTTNSYIQVQYNCNTKDFDYKEIKLIWK